MQSFRKRKSIDHSRKLQLFYIEPKMFKSKLNRAPVGRRQRVPTVQGATEKYTAPSALLFNVIKIFPGGHSKYSSGIFRIRVYSVATCWVTQRFQLPSTVSRMQRIRIRNEITDPGIIGSPIPQRIMPRVHSYVTPCADGDKKENTQCEPGPIESKIP